MTNWTKNKIYKNIKLVMIKNKHSILKLILNIMSKIYLLHLVSLNKVLSIVLYLLIIQATSLIITLFSTSLSFSNLYEIIRKYN